VPCVEAQGHAPHVGPHRVACLDHLDQAHVDVEVGLETRAVRVELHKLVELRRCGLQTRMEVTSGRGLVCAMRVNVFASSSSFFKVPCAKAWAYEVGEPEGSALEGRDGEHAVLVLGRVHGRGQHKEVVREPLMTRARK